MHSVYCYSLTVWWRSKFKKGIPCDLFWPRIGSAPGRIWPKNNNACKGPWVLYPYQVSSKSIKRFWRRSRKCGKFTDAGWTTDGRLADDGRCAMTSILWKSQLLPVKFRWISFGGFSAEVQNVSDDQMPGRPSWLSDRPEKHKLCPEFLSSCVKFRSAVLLEK